MVELRHLRYFVAVAEELNFSRAAERLDMAQLPLSVAVRHLEQELGTDLLLGTTREVRLTDAGQAFLDGARRTLLELQGTESGRQARRGRRARRVADRLQLERALRDPARARASVSSQPP
jgi:DNA-binding transcriptional LysR family regulator